MFMACKAIPARLDSVERLSCAVYLTLREDRETMGQLVNPHGGGALKPLLLDDDALSAELNSAENAKHTDVIDTQQRINTSACGNKGPGKSQIPFTNKVIQSPCTNATAEVKINLLVAYE